MKMNKKNLMIAVMSFNMGSLLENCVNSIHRHATGVNYRIYDDGSNDNQTLNVLNRISACGVSVTVRDREKTKNNMAYKTGGLFDNMNRAIEDAALNGFEYVLFIQDDMQIVRPLDDNFYDEYTEIWNSDPLIAQIRCSFMKNPIISPDHISDRWKRKGSVLCFTRCPDTHGVLDTGFVKVGLLKNSGFKYVNGESKNAALSKAKGLYSVFPFNPIAMFLPYPPTISNRLPLYKRAIQKVTDWYCNVGLHSFKDMSDDDVLRLKNRLANELPYAESYLELNHGDFVPRPWHYEHSYAITSKLLSLKIKYKK